MQRRNVAARGRLRALLALVAGSVAALSLALPMAAQAHPGVYEVTPETIPGGTTCTWEEHPEGECLTEGAVQYAISNDGWAMGYTESNGITGITPEGTAGLIDYKKMPTAFRASMTPEDRLAYEPAQTGVQPHATCQGVAVLSDPENIVAWQEREDHDVFFNYIPWQKASAGLGDEPSRWIPVVHELTGVDLSALSSEAEFEAACDALEGGNGEYTKADTASVIDKATAALKVEAAVLPLNSRISALTGEASTLQSRIAAWAGKGSKLEGEKAALESSNTVLTDANAKLQRQLSSAKRASTKKAKTIKKLRKQLKQARSHG